MSIILGKCIPSLNNTCVWLWSISKNLNSIEYIYLQNWYRHTNWLDV